MSVMDHLRNKLFRQCKEETAERKTRLAVCEITDKQRAGCGCLVYDQQSKKYYILTTNKVIANDIDLGHLNDFEVKFNRESKCPKICDLKSIIFSEESVTFLDSGLVVIFVDSNCSKLKHGSKTCSVLSNSALIIGDCDESKQSFCFISNKRFNVEPNGESGEHFLKAANNNPNPAAEGVPDGIPNGLVILQGTGDSELNAVGILNYVDGKQMVISPIWLKGSINAILGRSPQQCGNENVSKQQPSLVNNGSAASEPDAPPEDHNNPSQTVNGSSAVDNPELQSINASGGTCTSQEHHNDAPPSGLNGTLVEPGCHPNHVPENDSNRAFRGGPSIEQHTASSPAVRIPDPMVKESQEQTEYNSDVPSNEPTSPTPQSEVDSSTPSGMEFVLGLTKKSGVNKEGAEKLEVTDQLISKAVTDNTLLLEKLSKHLDRESRVIKCWKHLAYVLNVPAEETRKFDMYTEHSPTEDMFNYLADTWRPDLTVKELKVKLKAVHRNDVIDSLNEGGFRDEMNVSDLMSGQPKFIALLSDKLESGTIGNWRSLATQFDIRKQKTEQFGLRGSGPTGALFSHMRTTEGLRDLTVGQLTDHFRAMELNNLVNILEKPDYEDSCLVRTVAVDGSELLADIGECLNKDKRAFKNWRNLANGLKIPHEVYDAFDTSKEAEKSPTKMLFEWLATCKPHLSVGDLLTGLEQIDRYDVVELVTKETTVVFFAKLRRDLEKNASEKGFLIYDNPGGGNCLFYALSQQLQLSQGVTISHGELRRTLVQYLEEHPQLPAGTNLPSFVASSWTDYLEDMAKDGTWRDRVILTAAANCYKCVIRVISSLPHHDDVIITPDPPVCDAVQLVVGHIHEKHYVSLITRQSGA